MKNLIYQLTLAAALGVTSTGWATLINFTGSGGSYSASWSGSTAIADYPSAGVGAGLNFSDTSVAQITSVSVTFTTSGGWNGDLYAYLSHGSGVAILLNRVGASAPGDDGYSTSGFNNITLTASGTDIHTISAPTTGGTYGADGRLDYTSGTRGNTLSVFDGGDPNGGWTLYFSDQSSLSTVTLTGWQVNITAIPLDVSPVPEPVNVALGFFGGLMGLVVLSRSQPVKRLLGKN